MARKFKTLPIIRFYVGGMMLILFLLLPVFVSILIFFNIDMSAEESIYGIIIACSFPVMGATVIHIAFWEKCFAFVTISDKTIVWKCLFRRSIKILRSDCKHVGLEYETSAMPFEYPYIYFASFHYPDKNYKGPIKIKCKEGLIKFRCTPELVEYVMKEFSEKTTYVLCSYYRENKERYKQINRTGDGSLS